MSDIDFLREMQTRLAAGRNGDPTEFEMLETMIGDWIHELENLPKFSVQELRPEVMAFALLMEQRLREKDADKGQRWKEADIGNLQVCATTKTYSLDAALTVRGDQAEAAKHAVDLANYAMMIADVAGALKTEEEGGPGWTALDQVQMP